MTDEKKWKCPYCQKKFEYMMDRDFHRRTHKEFQDLLNEHSGEENKHLREGKK